MLEGLLSLLGGKKKAPPLDVLCKLRAASSKACGANALRDLPEFEELIRTYEKQYDVVGFKESAQNYRAMLYPKKK